MGLRYIEISTDLIAKYLATGHELARTVIAEGLPPDAKVVKAWMPDADRVFLEVESAEFEVTERVEGHPIVITIKKDYFRLDNIDRVVDAMKMKSLNTGEKVILVDLLNDVVNCK